MKPKKRVRTRPHSGNQADAWVALGQAIRSGNQFTKFDVHESPSGELLIDAEIADPSGMFKKIGEPNAKKTQIGKTKKAK